MWWWCRHVACSLVRSIRRFGLVVVATGKGNPVQQFSFALVVLHLLVGALGLEGHEPRNRHVDQWIGRVASQLLDTDRRCTTVVAVPIPRTGQGLVVPPRTDNVIIAPFDSSASSSETTSLEHESCNDCKASSILRVEISFQLWSADYDSFLFGP
jgi:hypothetical protein